MIGLMMNIIMLVLLTDSMIWSVYLYRHSFYIKKMVTELDLSCGRITYGMLGIASLMTGIFIVGLGVFWMWITVFCGYNILYFILISSCIISLIHMYSLLAHCTCLDVKYWPIISKCISKHIVKRFKG